jgi:hypothetical protein
VCPVTERAGTGRVHGAVFPGSKLLYTNTLNLSDSLEGTPMTPTQEKEVSPTAVSRRKLPEWMTNEAVV